MKLFGFEIRRAKSKAVRFMGELVKLDVAPGDVCVLMCSQSLSQDGANRLRETWRFVMGDDVTLIVLDGGMRLGVLSPQKAAEVHARLEDEAVVEKAVGG